MVKPFPAMENWPLSHGHPSAHTTRPRFVGNTHSLNHTHNDTNCDDALHKNATCAYMRSSTRGSPNSYTEHDHQYWSFSPPIPSWKLYENPFYTEGHLVPAYVPRYLNAPLHRRAHSFSTPHTTQHTSSRGQASRGFASNSHHGLTILAPGFAIKASITSDDPPYRPNAVPPPSDLALSNEKCAPGPLVVSARKLAASFWEQYAPHELDEAVVEHSSRAQAPQSCSERPPSDTLVCPSLPSEFQIPEAPESTTENCGTEEAIDHNMASSPVATLANVLHRMQSVEENQSQSTALLGKLTLDMEDVATRIQELEFSHKSALREINSLLQRFGERMAISRRKEQEKARLAFLHLREEMEEERKACRMLKLQNQKLSKDLTHANIAAADACEELDRERKARELLEEVCNELAREIGEDKAEVEQLKQEQVESRKRLEEEIRMMRVAAMWRGERVRSELPDAQLNKEGMPLHELRSKLEAFVRRVGGTCRGTEEDIEVPAERAKLLRQALELLELEEFRESQSNAKVLSSAARLGSGPACTNTCLIDKKVSSDPEYGAEGHHFHEDTDTVNGLGSKFSSKETRKPRKSRRRLRMIAQQRHNRSQARVYDQNKITFWEARCANSSWPSSDDEPERGQFNALPNSMQAGHALEQGTKERKLSVHTNSPNSENENTLLANGHTVQKTWPSMYVRASEYTIKKDPCHQEQSAHSGIGEGSHRKHSSSARFEMGAGRELDCKGEGNTGPSVLYSFSEDDAASCTGDRIERRRKQQSALHALSMLASKSRQEKEERFAFIRNARYDHDHLINSERTGQGSGVGTKTNELDDFYFEPVRGPSNASDVKLNIRVGSKDEDGARHIENGCGDEACCRIVAKASQACKDIKDLVHDSVESSRVLVEGKEAMNKTSPWRSASAKPLPCFWPPSPDAFAIFGGAKKRSKAGSFTPPAVHIDNEQQIHRVGGLHSHSQRDPSPAKDALSSGQQEQDNSMKSNSLGAQLIKARELDCSKPAKPSFRFSPLRRAISHG